MVTSELLPAWRSHRSACKLAQTRISMEDIIKGVWPLMVAQLIVLLLLILFPTLVTVPARWSRVDEHGANSTALKHALTKGSQCDCRRWASCPKASPRLCAWVRVERRPSRGPRTLLPSASQSCHRFRYIGT